MHRVGDSLSFRFCHRFSLTLLLMHRAGGYNYVPSLHACPLLVMLPFPGGFPLQSQTLCPERHSLPTFLHSVEIQLAVRRRTRAFPPPLRWALSRSHTPLLCSSRTEERRKKLRDASQRSVTLPVDRHHPMSLLKRQDENGQIALRDTTPRDGYGVSPQCGE
jgi:hypothetical protein